MENQNINVNEEVEVKNNEATQEANQEKVKMFTQEEVDAILEKRLARESKKIKDAQEKEYRAKLETELKESERLMQMNEADRAKAQAEKDRKKLEEKERILEEQIRVFEQEKIKTQTMSMLGERNIPVELVQFIVSQNADEILDNVNTFEKHFNQAVEKVVLERLRGKTPQVGVSKSKDFDAFLEGFKKY